MPDETEKVRAKLIKLRDELRQLSDIASEARGTVRLDQTSVGRLSRMDAMQRQAMAEATERQRQRDLAQIDAALVRLDDGDYGICLDCGEDIAAKRLEHNPAATHCINCAR